MECGEPLRRTIVRTTFDSLLSYCIGHCSSHFQPACFEWESSHLRLLGDTYFRVAHHFWRRHLWARNISHEERQIFLFVFVMNILLGSITHRSII